MPQCACVRLDHTHSAWENLGEPGSESAFREDEDFETCAACRHVRRSRHAGFARLPGEFGGDVVFCLQSQGPEFWKVNFVSIGNQYLVRCGQTGTKRVL